VKSAALNDYSGRVPSTKLLLANGELLEVEGLIEDVEKRLQNAVRSSPGTLAWLEESGTDEPIAVNPAHVVTLKRGDE
jgi:hypothetical protein